MTATMELVVEEEEADSMDFSDLCEELEALERRVLVQRLHIQHVKLEEDEGAYQPEEWLEEVENVSVEKETEQELQGETAEMESAAEWPLSATKGDKDIRGYQVDLPTDKDEEVHPRGLHTRR
jgi:hypothetical protein